MGPNEPEVNKLFRLVMKMEASDLHLKVGQPPMMRLRGDMRRTEMRPLLRKTWSGCCCRTCGRAIARFSKKKAAWTFRT